MSENTAQQYEHEDAPATPRIPAQVVTLHPTAQQRGKVRARRMLAPERSAEVVLAVTTIVLSGLLFLSLSLYRGLQHYLVF